MPSILPPEPPRQSDLRDQLLLALARADGQPWVSIAEASRHTAEIMYGAQADAVLQLLEATREEAARAARQEAFLAAAEQCRVEMRQQVHQAIRARPSVTDPHGFQQRDQHQYANERVAVLDGIFSNWARRDTGRG